MKRFSLRLSLISAWLRLASPLMTLMKSKTTRRSQPITRSRLRRPTSKSITTVRLPRSARPVAKAAAVVVLPTPPLPDVTTTTLPKAPSLLACMNRLPLAPARQDRQPVVDQRHLRRVIAMLRRNRLGDEIAAGDRHQLRGEALGEDAGVLVAGGAGDGSAAQGAVDMDVAVGDELGAGAHCRNNDEIAALGIDLHPRAHGLGDEPRAWALGRRAARSGAGGAGAERRQIDRLRRTQLQRARILHPHPRPA